jgi:hypothetical protein
MNTPTYRPSRACFGTTGQHLREPFDTPISRVRREADTALVQIEPGSDGSRRWKWTENTPPPAMILVLDPDDSCYIRVDHIGNGVYQ